MSQPACVEGLVNIYIYIYIYISQRDTIKRNYSDTTFIIIMSHWQHRVPWLCHYPSLSSTLLLGLLDCTQCPYTADVCKSFLVGQHQCIHVLESIREHRLKVCPYFCSSASYVLFEWFVRWKVSGCTASVLQRVTSRICSKRLIASLFSSNLLMRKIATRKFYHAPLIYVKLDLMVRRLKYT